MEHNNQSSNLHPILYSLQMYDLQRPSCTKCKQKDLVVPLYCCNPSELFCSKCSIKICSKCHRSRTHYYHINDLPRRETKIIKCDLCLDMQSLTSTEYFYENRCKKYYCHSCMVKHYNQFNDTIKKMEAESIEKVELPVDLACGCEISKQAILDYMGKYCYYCSEKLSGRTILLQNQCKITENCYIRLKREAERYYPSEKDKKNWKFIQESLIYCMNCDEMIDGQIKRIGNKIDGLNVCTTCLYRTQITEKALYNSRKQENAKDQYKKQDLKREIIEQKGVKEGEKELRAPIELGGKGKPHLVNGRRYTQTRCIKCNAGMEILKDQKPICQMCIKPKQFSPAQNSSSQTGKFKKEDLFENEKKLLASRKEEENKVKIQNAKLLPEQKEKRIEVIEEKVSKGKQIIQIQQNKPKDSIKRQESKNQTSKIIGLQNKDIELKAIQLKERQSNINQQFLPLKVDKISININKIDQAYCSKCNYVLDEQYHYQVYEKEVGEEDTLRIAETEEEKTKYEKEKRLAPICCNCFFSLKLKLKLMQDKRQLDLYSRPRDRFNSAAKEPKKYEPVPATFSDSKKVDQKPSEESQLRCHYCFNLVASEELKNMERSCKKCQEKASKKPQVRNQCRHCFRQYIKQVSQGARLNYCPPCRLALRL